jgi:hypothetical protein
MSSEWSLNRMKIGGRPIVPPCSRMARSHGGNTQEEALKHLQEVVQLVVEELMEDNEPIPEDVQVSLRRW